MMQFSIDIKYEIYELRIDIYITEKYMQQTLSKS